MTRKDPKWEKKKWEVIRRMGERGGEVDDVREVGKMKLDRKWVDRVDGKEERSRRNSGKWTRKVGL